MTDAEALEVIEGMRRIASMASEVCQIKADAAREVAKTCSPSATKVFLFVAEEMDRAADDIRKMWNMVLDSTDAKIVGLDIEKIKL